MTSANGLLRKLRRSAIAVATCLFAPVAAAGCVGADGNGDAHSGVDVEMYSDGAAGSDIALALLDSVPALMEAAGVPGLSLALVEDGHVTMTAAFGYANAETEEPVSEATVFEAASLSKQAFAYAVLKMADRGELDLDAPVWDLLEYDRLAHDERARKITPRMLLSHSGGLPNWGGTPLQLNFDPGTNWGYSGEGYVFLQKALEAKTGLTLDEIAEREVFEPLGMTSSHFVWVPAYDTLAASPHEETGIPEDVRVRTEANAAASLYTTARDYGLLMAAFLTGEGLSADLYAEVFTPQAELAEAEWGDDPEAKRNLAWGLGWGIQRGSRGPGIWQWGDNGTARGYVVAFPEDGTGLVYFTNSQGGLSIAEALVRVVAPEDEHWGLRFLDYGRFDSPRLIARIAVKRAFIEEGMDAGIEALRAAKADDPYVLEERHVNGIGYFLLGRDRVAEAIAVFEENTRDYPESANVWDSLGEGYMSAGEYAPAIENYRKSLELDPDNEGARQRIAWMEFELEAAGNPVSLSEAELARFAGTYGPRTIALRDGQLFYVREESDRPESAMRPLTAEIFVVEGIDDFRIRFETDRTGDAIALEGIYLGGDTDRSPRDP